MPPWTSSRTRCSSCRKATATGRPPNSPWFSSLTPQDDDSVDPLETLEALAGSDGAESAADKVERAQVIGIIEEEVARLPARQREAFLMRYWEEMDVAETAAAMGCSEGSVKTHCSRATATLAKALSARGIKL
jgi:RNA polymerase sigma-70 factor (ECF subfamily)